MRWLPLLLLVAACDELPVVVTTPEGDSDTDTDSDSDADSDADADTDTTATDVTGAQKFVDLGDETSNNSSLAYYTVHVGPKDTAFLFFATGEDYLSIENIKDPNGKVVTSWDDWVDGYDLTDAFWPYYKDVSFSWPMREEDGPLMQGDWTIAVATVDKDWYYVDQSDMHASVRLKQDDDFSSGKIHARVVYTGTLDKDDAVVEAVEAAVDRWKEVYGAIGLTLTVEYLNSTEDADLDYPSWNSADIEAISQDLDGQEVDLIVGETIDNDMYLYGVAGGIPGPLDPSPRAGVVVSYLAHSGANGQFDDDEIRLMGETFAHEVGHYLGLHHPVQSNYKSWDALDDTPKCTSAGTCEGQLGDNLMFPYSLCDFSSCAPQYVLTDDQAGELHRAGAAL